MEYQEKKADNDIGFCPRSDLYEKSGERQEECLTGGGHVKQVEEKRHNRGDQDTRENIGKEQMNPEIRAGCQKNGKLGEKDENDRTEIVL